MKKKFYGNDIEPKCAYCTYGSRAKEGNKVLCEKQGLVDDEYNCKKFEYDPLKRIPKKQLSKEEKDDELI